MKHHLFFICLFVASFACAQETGHELKALPAPEQSQAPRVYVHIDVPATFPGGKDSLNAYLERNLIYPASAREPGIKGKCYLQFIVSASGNVSNVRIKKGIAGCIDCDKEAIRVIRAMPKWEPGKNGGEPVHSAVDIQVVFDAK